MADKSGVYKYYNGKEYDNIYFKTKGSLVEQDANHRFMTDTERKKLNGVAEGANKYAHPSNHPATMIQEDTNHRFMTDAERKKLSGIAEGANKYVHPLNHPATMIQEDTNHKFVKESEKSVWNAKANTTLATTSTSGLMSSADKKKLDGIEQVIKSFVLKTFYPIGSIYMSTSSNNPKNLFGGEWMQWGAGRVPVGVGTGKDAKNNVLTFSSADSSGGEYYHKLTVNEMPNHGHEIKMTHGEDFVIPNKWGTGGACTDPKTQGHWFTQSIYAASVGGNGNHNNIQPYITCYMWKRTK